MKSPQLSWPRFLKGNMVTSTRQTPRTHVGAFGAVSTTSKPELRLTSKPGNCGYFIQGLTGTLVILYGGLKHARKGGIVDRYNP